MNKSLKVLSALAVTTAAVAPVTAFAADLEVAGAKEAKEVLNSGASVQAATVATKDAATVLAEAARDIINGHEVPVTTNDVATVLTAIKKLDTAEVKNTVLANLTTDAINITRNVATVTLKAASGDSAAVTATVVVTVKPLEVPAEVTAAQTIINGKTVKVTTNDVVSVLAAIKELDTAPVKNTVLANLTPDAINITENKATVTLKAASDDSATVTATVTVTLKTDDEKLADAIKAYEEAKASIPSEGVLRNLYTPESIELFETAINEAYELEITTNGKPDAVKLTEAAKAINAAFKKLILKSGDTNTSKPLESTVSTSNLTTSDNKTVSAGSTENPDYIKLTDNDTKEETVVTVSEYYDLLLENMFK